MIYVSRVSILFLRSVMENLIREILDHGDGVTPILGVYIAPLVICYEDREGNKEEAEGYNKEDSGNIIHDRSPFLQTQAQCGHMSHSDDQRCRECNTSNPFEDGHAQKHNHLRVTGIPLFLQMGLVGRLQNECNSEDSIDGDNDHATIGKERNDPVVETHF